MTIAPYVKVPSSQMSPVFPVQVGVQLKVMKDIKKTKADWKIP